MSSKPWHKRWHSDALTGYRGLSLEERGAYSTILDLLYDHGEAINQTERWWAGQMDCSTRKWRSLRDNLADKGKILTLADGTITNKRFEKELENDAKTSRKRAELGAKGGRNKAENQKKANKNNDGPDVLLKQKSSLPEARSHIPDIDDDDSARELTIQCMDAANLDPLRRMHQTPFVARWLKAASEAGVPKSAILETVRDVTARKRDGPPNSLKYFNQPIADTIRAYTEPMPEGRNAGNNNTKPTESGVDRLLAFVERERAGLPDPDAESGGSAGFGGTSLPEQAGDSGGFGGAGSGDVVDISQAKRG